MGYVKAEEIPTRIEVNIVGEDRIKEVLYAYILKNKHTFGRDINDEPDLPDAVDDLRIECCTPDQITVSWQKD